jgi:hypothetical protein
VPCAFSHLQELRLPLQSLHLPELRLLKRAGRDAGGVARLPGLQWSTAVIGTFAT